jgi:hypothetical protein
MEDQRTWLESLLDRNLSPRQRATFEARVGGRVEAAIGRRAYRRMTAWSFWFHRQAARQAFRIALRQAARLQRRERERVLGPISEAHRRTYQANVEMAVSQAVRQLEPGWTRPDQIDWEKVAKR